MHHAGSQHVVQRDDAIDLDTGIQQRVHSPHAIDTMPHARFDDQPIIEFDAGLLQSLKITLITQRGGTDLLTPMHADHRHMPAAGRQQILRGPLRAFDVLRGDVVHLVGEDAFADQHEWIIDLQLLDVILPKLQGAVDQAVDHRLLGAMQRFQLAVARILRRLHDHAQADLLSLFDDERRQLRKIRHLQVGNGQTDDAGLALAQVARRNVHRIPEFRDGFVDLVASGLRDKFVIVDNVGDRFYRHAGRFGHLAHGHDMIAAPRSSLRHIYPSTPSVIQRAQSPSQPTSIVTPA